MAIYALMKMVLTSIKRYTAPRFFTAAIYTPHPPQTVFTPLELTLSLELSKPSIAATSIVAGE